MEKIIKLCECGCGTPTTVVKGIPRRFINHHYIRLHPISQSEKFKKLMTGENNPSKRPEVRQKISKAVTGKNMGDSNPMRRPELRKLFSERFRGLGNPMFGKKASIETRKKMSCSQLKITNRWPRESREKLSNSLKGREKSKEYRDKISKTFKEKGISNGKNNPFYGKSHTPETISKLSKKSKERYKIRGNHPAWKGGITPLHHQIRGSDKYSLWRMSVFRRDFFACQSCGKKKNVKIRAHHNHKTFAKICNEYKISTLEQALCCNELWDVGNGITLCEECHINIHRKR